MSVAGALIGGALGSFGKKPKVPDLTDINPNQVQAQTVAGNLTNFADIAKLAAGVNTFNQDQLNALIDRTLPGAREQISKNISSQLRGEIPEDVVDEIYNQNAQRGGALTSGSGFLRNREAKQLGLTSLGIINNALSSAESWLKTATAPQFDVSSMFFTPQQRLSFEVQQQGAKFNRDLIAAGVAAAPDPATAALGREIDRFFNTAAKIGTMSLGGMGGGGLGGGGGGGGGGLGGGGGFTTSPNSYEFGGMPSFNQQMNMMKEFYGGDSYSGSANGQGI